MSPERWSRLRELFDRAVDMPPEQRAALLRSEQDEELRAQVESLILADDGADQAMRHALAGAAIPALKPGDRLAQYEIVHSLGRGGMGEVFLARRHDDLEQKVAIKVSAARQGGEETARRFLSERRILATLDHPNIARFLDAGATPDGLLWVAMEFVAGQPITDHCNAAQLSLAERIEVFASVCRAVQYAHSNLVVHRDIKPANILVDANGEPKLLDFGIAKLLNGTDEGNATRTNFRPMTPQYASPEQIHGGTLTTATDVYSLGVVLYELLTGRLPYQTGSTEPGALSRIILESNPPSLSDAAVTAGKPKTYTRQLAGDLDVIVRTAMHREVSRRYGSAAAVAEDLARCRKGFPIAARPDSLGYRTKRFIFRNRLASALAASLLCLIITFAAITGIQARRLAAERDAAQQTTAFLIGVFDAADRGKSNGEAVNARQLLDRGAARIENELKSKPGTQARLYDAIGHVYQNLGLPEQARLAFVKQLTLRRGAGAEGDAALAISLKNLAEAMRQLSKYDEAQSLATEALAVTRRSSPAVSFPVADSLNSLGLILTARGRPIDAEAPLKEALAIKRKIFPVAGFETASTLNNLADAYNMEKKYTEANAPARESLAIRERLFGDDDARTALAMMSLGMNLNNLGQFAESEVWFRKALTTNTKLYGSEHPTTATIANSLASLLHDQKRYDDAEVLYRQALAVQEKVQGEFGSGVAITLNNLASLYQDRGDLATAEPLFLRSLAIRVRLYGNDSTRVATAKINLGRFLMLRRRFGQARAIFGEVIATGEKLNGGADGKPNADLAIARFNFAMATDKVQGRVASLPLAKAALEQVTATLPAENPARKRIEAAFNAYLAEKR